MLIGDRKTSEAFGTKALCLRHAKSAMPIRAVQIERHHIELFDLSPGAPHVAGVRYHVRRIPPRYLNVTTDLISQWERGEKHPQGASLKLLSRVARRGLGAVA
jgi:hypothetical protein